MQAIFRDTGQCLHFAYMIQQYPNTAPSTLASAMRVEIKASGIDFGGLSPNEIRDECSKIRNSVRAILASHEAAALIAKYSTDQQERDRAIRVISNHIAPALHKAIKDRRLIFAIVERHYIPDDERGPKWSLRALSDQFKVSKDKIHRTAKVFEQYARQIEIIALDNLRREFEKQQIVQSKEAA